MANLTKITRAIQDGDGTIQPSASCEIRYAKDDVLVAVSDLFELDEVTNKIGNPFLADAVTGKMELAIRPGRYRVEVTAGGEADSEYIVVPGEVHPNFATRAEAVTYVAEVNASGRPWPNGTEFRADGIWYVWASGATMIVDMQNILPGPSIGMVGPKHYKNTLAELQAIAGTDGDAALVWNDPTPANNAAYKYDAGIWKWDADLPPAFFPVQMSGPGLIGRLTGAGAPVEMTPSQVREVLDVQLHTYVWSQDPNRDHVIIDRVNNTISFPRLAVQRPGKVAVAIDPVGDPWFTTLPFPTAEGDFHVYYIDVAASAVTYTTDPLLEESDTKIIIGRADGGSFLNRNDFDVLDEHPTAALQSTRAGRGDVGVEAIMAAVEALPHEDVKFGRDPIIVSGSTPMGIGSPVKDGLWQCTGATAELDLSNMLEGSNALVKFGANGGNVFAGYGRTFTNSPGNNLASYGANQVAEFRRAAAGLVLSQDLSGPAAYSAISEPVRAVSIVSAGQSPMEYGFGLGLPCGFEAGLRDATWVESAVAEGIFWIEGARGGSSIATGSNRWINGTANDVGMDEFEAAVGAAIAAGQPVPEIVLWSQGEADAINVNNGTKTVAQMQADIETVWGKIRTYLIGQGASDPQIIVAITGSNETVTQRSGMSGVRWAYQQAIAATAYAHFGAEAYDLPRAWGDIHLSGMGYYSLGYRLARAYANVAHGQANDLGPVPVSAALKSGTNKIAVVALPSGLVIPRGNLADQVARGPFPFGVIVHRSTFTGIQREVEVIRGRFVDATTLELESYDNMTGCFVAFPAGWFPESREREFVRSDDPHVRMSGLPLRSWVSGALS